MRRTGFLLFGIILFVFVAILLLSANVEPTALPNATSLSSSPVQTPSNPGSTNADPALSSNGQRKSASGLTLETRLSLPNNYTAPEKTSALALLWREAQKPQQRWPLSVLGLAIALSIIGTTLMRPGAQRSALATHPVKSGASNPDETIIQPGDQNSSTRFANANLSLPDSIQELERVSLQRDALNDELTIVREQLVQSNTEREDTLLRLEKNERDLAALVGKNNDDFQPLADGDHQESDVLHRELQERDTVISELHQDIRNWEEQWRSHDEQLNASNEELVATRAQHRDVMHELNDSQTELLEARSRIKSLDETLAELSIRAERAVELDQQIEHLNEKLETLAIAHEDLQEKYRQASDETTQLPALILQIEQLSADLATVQTERDELRGALDEQSESSLEQTSQLKALEIHEEQLGDSVHQLTEQLTQTNRTLDWREQAYQELDKNYQEQQETLAQQKRDLDEVQEHLARTETELNQTYATLRQAHESLSGEQALVQELSIAQQQLEEERNTLQENLQDSEAALAQHQENNLILDESVTTLRNDLSQLVGKVGDKQVEVTQWQADLANEKRLAIGLQEQIDGLQARIKEQQEEREALNEQLFAATHTEQRLNTWDNTIQTYVNEIRYKSQIIDSLRDQLTAREADSAKHLQSYEYLSKQLEVYRSVRDELESVNTAQQEIDTNIAEQNETLSSLQESLAAQSEIEQALSAESTELQNQREKWLEELRENHSIIQQLEAELLEQHGTLDQLTRDLQRQLSFVSEEFLPDGIVDAGNNSKPETLLAYSESLGQTIRSLQARLESEQLSYKEDRESTTLVLQAEIADHIEQLAASEEKVAAGAARETEISEQLERHKIQIAEQEQDIDQLTSDIQARQSELDDAHAELQTRRDDYQVQLETHQSLRQDHLKLQDAKQVNESELSKARALLEAHQIDIKSSAEKLRATEEELEAMRGEQLSASTELDQLRDTTESLQQALITLEHTNQQHEERIEEYVAEVTEKQQALMRLAQSQEKHESEQLKLTEQLSSLREHFESWRARANKLHQEKIQLQDQLNKTKEAAMPVPVLTQQVARGAAKTDVPVLGKPLKRNDQIPVLGKPVREPNKDDT